MVYPLPRSTQFVCALGREIERIGEYHSFQTHSFITMHVFLFYYDSLNE